MIRVLHLIDSLETGGAERMAVNLANGLAKRGIEIHLCATRKEGPLKGEISPEVHYLFLNRRSRFDILALAHLIRYIKLNNINILHAHNSSIYIGMVAVGFTKKQKLLWHIHTGALSSIEYPHMLSQFIAHKINGAIVVNDSLLKWTTTQLGLRTEKVWLLGNFVHENATNTTKLPGISGFRIVCVANLRKEKDHITLIQAMKEVIKTVPQAHLLLVGSAIDREAAEMIFSQIHLLELGQNVTWLGTRNDIQNILASCDIGALSSISEGLPLVLLEYGIAGLPVVATDVGDCGDVLDSGKAGVLVPPRSPQLLAESLIGLLQNPMLRKELGFRLQERVKEKYSPSSSLNKLESIYLNLLSIN